MEIIGAYQPIRYYIDFCHDVWLWHTLAMRVSIDCLWIVVDHIRELSIGQFLTANVLV